MLIVKIDGEEFEYNERKLLNTEASMVQKFTGLTMKEWFEGLDQGNVDCITAMVWVVYFRAGKLGADGRPIKYSEVVFDLAQFDMTDPEADKQAAENADDDAAEDPTPPAPLDNAVV